MKTRSYKIEIKINYCNGLWRMESDKKPSMSSVIKLNSSYEKSIRIVKNFSFLFTKIKYENS